MSELERYEAVNNANTLEKLADVVRSFADENGMIQGRERQFNAEDMAEKCANCFMHPYEVLTRNWGIRQQAMMLIYYKR